MNLKIPVRLFAALLLLGGASLAIAQRNGPNAKRNGGKAAPNTAPVVTFQKGLFEKVPLPREPPPSPEEVGGGQMMRDRKLLREIFFSLDFAPLAAQPNSV